jgi:hypothetical protein
MAIAAVAGVLLVGALPGGPVPALTEAGQLQRRAAADAVRHLAAPPSNSRAVQPDPRPLAEPATSIPPAPEPISSVTSGAQVETGAPEPTESAPPAVAVASPVVSGALPGTAFRAYRHAAEVLSDAAPACHLPWSLLAGIGRVESDHGRFGGNTLDAGGTAHPGILGPPLNGAGFAAIRDTDGGRWDGDRVWDRAVGPMQFIPSTWRSVAMDGNGDGIRNPQNIDDAALAAGVYLCAYGTDLGTDAGARIAVFGYNHSASYVAEVLALARGYAFGTGSLAAEPATSASRNLNPGVPAPDLDRTDEPASAPSSGPRRPSPERSTSPSPPRTQPSSPRRSSSHPAAKIPKPAPTTAEPSATHTATPTAARSPKPSTTPTSAPSPQPTPTPTPTRTRSAQPTPTTAPTSSSSNSASSTATPTTTPTEPPESASASPTVEPVVCQDPDLQAGTLGGCERGAVELQQYLCRDPQTDRLMRLGAKPDGSDDPPVCEYDAAITP